MESTMEVLLQMDVSRRRKCCFNKCDHGCNDDDTVCEHQSGGLLPLGYNIATDDCRAVVPTCYDCKLTAKAALSVVMEQQMLPAAAGIAAKAYGVFNKRP
jgi:hypothetical protein